MLLLTVKIEIQHRQRLRLHATLGICRSLSLQYGQISGDEPCKPDRKYLKREALELGWLRSDVSHTAGRGQQRVKAPGLEGELPIGEDNAATLPQAYDVSRQLTPRTHT